MARYGSWLVLFFPVTEPVTRACSVPAGQVLFFPVANYFSFDTPGICGQGVSLSVAEQRDASADVVDGVTSKSVTVDGQPFKHIQRIQSKVFDVALPENNVFDELCISFELGDVPAGIYSPGVDDGYYAAIGPFQPGNHTVHILASGSISQDITYNLTVVPVTLQ